MLRPLGYAFSQVRPPRGPTLRCGRKILISLYIALSAPHLASEMWVYAQSPQPAPTAPTLKVYSRETIVDVTVTDKNGSPIHGLTRDDFTIKEDGKPQSIQSFAEFGTQPLQPPPKLPPNVYTNLQPPAASSATNILWFDFTNAAPVLSIACCILPLPSGDPTLGPIDLARSTGWQKHAKEYAEQYVKEMQAGTRVAVFGTSFPYHLRVLQSVTSDPALLSAAIDTMRYDTDGMVAKPAKEEWCAQQDRRNRMTLESLMQIAADLAQIKGRKNLLWYSARIRSLTDQHPDPCLTNLFPEVQKAYGRLAAARVTVYPISVRGVEENNQDKAEDILGLETVAEATGGKAYYNSNDLADLTAKAMHDGSDYYTLSYVPPGTVYDGRHHTIKVEVADHPGLQLTYRDEYYAEDPTTDALGRKVKTVSPMQTALMRGALDATQILFRVKVVESPGTEASLPASNQPDAKLMKPPYRHYSLDYLIDVHGIDFATSPDGNYRSAFEYAVRVYNADSDQVLNSISTTVKPILPPTVYRSMLSGGANANQEIDVPATGNYILRIAVHDLTSDRVGAIEIPTTSIAPTPTPTVISQ